MTPKKIDKKFLKTFQGTKLKPRPSFKHNQLYRKCRATIPHALDASTLSPTSWPT